MPESHDLGLGGELFLQPFLRTIRRLDLFEHFHRFFVRSAVQWSFQRADRRRHRRVNSSQRGCGHTRCKRRRVEFVVCIQIENRIHHPRLPGLRHPAIQFVKEIAGLAQLRFFRQWFFALRNPPAVRDQSHHPRNQFDRFANVSVMRVITYIFVERAQHRHTSAEHVHRMRRLRQKPQHLDDFLRQLALRGDLFLEFLQLLSVRQFAVQEQISDFLERRLVAHFVNVIAAVHQARVRIDPANLRFARDHAR